VLPFGWVNEPPGEPPQPTHAKVASPLNIVDSAAALADIVEALGKSAVPAAVDTEANSYYRYYERVCLFQIAFDGHARAVDPLALDLAPLLQALAGRTLLMHGADYDLRLLHRGYGFRPAAIFDTMIAAQLLGEKEIGLSALLSRRVGVTLDKSFQRADWSERPLSAELLAYAVADVWHLAELCDSMRADLEAKGRLSWHEEECARLVVGEFSERSVDFEEDWRIKGTNALTSKERAFVRALWQAREKRAQEIDRPPFRVLTNERLLDAARLAAAGERELGKLVPGKPLPGAFAQSVRAALEEARKLPPEDWPLPRRPEPYQAIPALERAIERLKKKRDQLAAALGLDPGVLASRGVLMAAAKAQLDHGRLDAERLAEESGISRWRAALLA